MQTAKLVLMYIMALLYFAAGVNHFIDPDFYMGIMPLYIPAHLFWVYFTGVAEILGAVGLLIPRTRRFAAWAIVAMLIGFFLVHVDMIVHAEARYANIPYPLLWLRIPIQFLLIAWAWWYTFPSSQEDASAQRD